MSSARSNYSLLDVVVVAILVTLISVLVLPTLSCVRAGDNRVKCINNLNHMASAMYMYSDVPANKFFPTRGSKKNPYADEKPMFALTLLYNRYIADPHVFVCPDSPPGVGGKIAELTAEQSAALDAAIKKLSSDEFEEREKASKTISALGLGANVKLAEALKTSGDTETKTRLNRLLAGFASNRLDERLKELTSVSGAVLEKNITYLSSDTCSYGYDPGHSPDDTRSVLMADRKGTGKNSDNHGANAGQNVLIGAGVVEWFDTPVHKFGEKEDPNIYAKNPETKLDRLFDAFVRQ